MNWSGCCWRTGIWITGVVLRSANVILAAFLCLTVSSAACRLNWFKACIGSGWASTADVNFALTTVAKLWIIHERWRLGRCTRHMPLFAPSPKTSEHRNRIYYRGNHPTVHVTWYCYFYQYYGVLEAAESMDFQCSPSAKSGRAPTQRIWQSARKSSSMCSRRRLQSIAEAAAAAAG